MPVPTETFWDTRKVSIAFAVSSVALLASIVWMVKVDYARPWRQFQEDYFETQRSLAHFEVLNQQTPEALGELAAARGAVDQAQKRLAAQQATTARLADALRSESKPEPAGLAREIIEQISGPMKDAYAARARKLDEALGNWIDQQIARPDASALAGRLGDRAFCGQLAQLLDWFNASRLAKRSYQILGEYSRAELLFKNLKSDKGVLEAAYEHEKGLQGESHPATREAKARLEAMTARFQEAKLRFDSLADERRAIEDQQKALEAPVTEAQRALARLEKQRNDAEKRYRELSDTLSRGIFNLPLLDFAAPKGTPGRHEIKQVVLPDVRVELNFLQSYATDRCMTCHVAIDDKSFTKENLARRLERAIIGANEEFKRTGEPPLAQPTVDGRADLQPGSVAIGWRTLSRAQQDRFFGQLVEQVNIYQARRGERQLEFDQPLLAHPDLELYISPDSPHPMSRMGCVVCHEGNGEETDFVLAAHTPRSHEERREWESKYYVRTGGLVPEIDFETAEHHWTRPMYVPKYSEAGCTKCHSQVADIATYNGRPAAQTINEGQMLFTTLGCINCHLVEQFADSRKVGPDLSHLAEKTTRGFVQNWIHFPADYRPSTLMPHFFEQENNDAQSERAGGDTDPALRTRAEVVAMTEYLLRVSNGYEREELPADLWEPLKDENSEAVKAARDRGRRLFGAVGCLACHANLAYRPNNETNVASEQALGEQWIVGDLRARLETLVHGVQEGKARLIKAEALQAARQEGKDPSEVKLGEIEGIEEKLAVSLEEGELPLARLIEIFRESFSAPLTQAAGHGAGSHGGAKERAAHAKKKPRGEKETPKLAGVHYDGSAALTRACEALLQNAHPAPQVELTEEDREALALGDDVLEAIGTAAQEIYGAMGHLDRAEYAMTNFRNAYDTLFKPDDIHGGPVFTRFAPELSSIGTKFQDYESGVRWLYDWLKNPRHYSEYTKMPRLRLARGEFPEIDMESGEPTGRKVDADEALDLAVYLAGLKDNEEFSTTPFDADAGQAGRLAAQRDELIKTLLGGLNSGARAQSILNDEGGELTGQLVSKLTRSLGEEEARTRIEGLNLEQRRWVFLGDKMIGHYGCYACHQIRGYETAARPGTELTQWGEKQLTQLDFAFFDPHFREEREKDPLFLNLYPENREKLIRWAHSNPPEDVEHTLASFAWHKVRNPRIWDRKKAKGPYDKLKMPNFFLNDRQTDAIVTFLLSRRPARVNPSLQANYGGPAGKLARGRNLARELNCVACHKIDGNAAVVHQYFQLEEAGERVFDEINAPPWLRGQGAKIQSDWLFGFLNNVEMLRPWLRIRMPSFHLTQEQSTQLVEYFFGLSEHESKWLAAHLAPVDRYVDEARKRAGVNIASADRGAGAGGAGDAGDKQGAEGGAPPGADWHQQESLAATAAALRDYAVENRLVTASAVDPATNSPEELGSTFQKIYNDASALKKLYSVSYPFPEPPVVASGEVVHDGEVIFTELKCLACHVFGDPAFPGANASPTAPNLQLAHKRLRRDWVSAWLESPQRLQPGTKMPNVFGQSDRVSAFADYPAEAKTGVEAKFHDKALVDDGAGQIEALISYLYDAGERRVDKVMPPEPAASEPATGESGSEPAEGSTEPAAQEPPAGEAGSSPAPEAAGPAGSAPAEN